MQPNNDLQLKALEDKIDAVYTSVEKMRKYMLITAWVTIGMIVLPLLGLIFVIPAFISSYVDPLSGL